MTPRRAFLALILCLTATAATARDRVDEAEGERKYRFGLEVKGHYRDSDDVAVTTAFPVPGRPQERIRLTSVEPGGHFEVSAVSLVLEARWGHGGWLAGRAKVDAIDLHDRNPTSTDSELDLDEAWLRFGREREPGDPALASGAYLKIGKMPKLERQDDRHLESYGLVSTAFNRMEDIGLELGWRLGRHLYGRASATVGNPVFFRDPTALAGDNGTPAQLEPGGRERGGGLAILYDFETERLDLDGRDPELGAGVGLRFGDDVGLRAVDVLVWAYRRDLAASVPIHGSFYGGDIDFLLGPENRFPYPLTDIEKREHGANLWLYLGGFSLFGQYVDQDLGGLERRGYEVELAWRFELPLFGALFGRQLLPSIAPSVRYSKLEPGFGVPRPTPSPSFAWDWEKIDLGVRLVIVDGFDLTAEHAINEFVVAGRTVANDETLITLRYLFGAR